MKVAHLSVSEKFAIFKTIVIKRRIIKEEFAQFLIEVPTTYDNCAGGFSIKTKTGMPGMKRDCGGAAGILGAFKAAVSSFTVIEPVRSKIRVHLPF